MSKFEFSEVELSREQKEKIDNDFQNKSGVIGNAKNAWTAIDLAVQLQDFNEISELGLVLEYENYLKRKNKNPLVVEYILAKSDKQGIKKFNDLVAEFNSEFENMKKGDFSKAREILKQVKDFFNRD